MLVENLPAIAALVVITLVGVYVALDGFDIGAGILLMRDTSREDRDAMIEATAFTRYASEWWLIAAAVAMYGAFPFPFRALASALAIPIAVMLAALAMRALAAARRRTAGEDGERVWSLIFAIASVVVALAQGFCLGGYIRGVSIAGGRFIGGMFDWAAPFALLVAIALTAGYALLGSSWLIFHTRGALSDRMRRFTRSLSIGAFFAMAAISVATLVVHPTISARWGISLDGVAWKYFLPLAPLPIGATLGLAMSYVGAGWAKSVWPFVGALGAFGAGYAGLAVSVWPYVVPYGFTAAHSAADHHALMGSLGWMAVAMPCLVIISVFAYARSRHHQNAPP